MFALDGVGHGIARDAWTKADLSCLDSVFPTVSSAAWLSSLTGLSVEDHGVPGVVFTMPGETHAENLYGYQKPFTDVAPGNIFQDARELGYRPVAILGDLAGYRCSWRDLLLTGAEVRDGTPMFTLPGTPYSAPSLSEVDTQLRTSIAEASAGGEGPCLIWCFVEIDSHIHHYGNDTLVTEFLRGIERLALDLAAMGTVVLAHSDHGHTRTRHDQRLQDQLDTLGARHGFSMGGAGRTRWLYPTTNASGDLIELLRTRLPGSVRVVSSDTAFTPGSVVRSRVGDILIVAEGEEFLAPPGYEYDHGSWTLAERRVPFARWGATDAA